ncbi:sugar ABC transporter permease [Globicatella sulfidifaciens]|nr:sugar ABC transporter permease [Globicatella sulfidifaciens]
MQRKKTLTGLLFVSPWIIGFLVLVAYPLYRTIFLSFNNVSYGIQSGWRYNWVGLENYQRILFEDIDFIVEVQDFFVSTVLQVPVIIALSIIIAVLLNQKIKGNSIFRLIFFLPVIILSGELMTNIGDYGGSAISSSVVIMDILETIIPSEEFILWIVSLFELIAQLMWYCAIPILIFLAALQNVNHSMYEAAAIDGASPWVTFWKITLPTIYPLVSVSVVFIVVFLANFEANPIIPIIFESTYDGSRREGYTSALSILYTFVQFTLIAILYFATRSKKN